MRTRNAKSVSPEEIVTIKELYAAGLSIVNIAKKTRRCFETVQFVLGQRGAKKETVRPGYFDINQYSKSLTTI